MIYINLNKIPWKHSQKISDSEKLILKTLFIIFFIQFCITTINFYFSFPNNYVWGEIFIKYTDGIVRRGLIGTLLYSLANFIDIQFFWTFFIAIIYIIFFISAYKYLIDTVSPFFTALLFFSPGLFAFHIKDQGLYGRKDILVLVLLGLAIILAGKMIRTQMPSWRNYLIIFICYCTSFLIHEITIFFSLLPAILVIRASKKKGLCIALITFIFIVSVAFAVLFQGSASMRNAMFHDWQNTISSFTEPGGMKFIGDSITAHEGRPLPWLKIYSLRVSYVAAWLLTLAPVLLLFYTYRCHTICISVIGRLLTYISYLCALFPAVTLTFLINDFGRIISYSCTIFLFFIIIILKIHRLSRERKRIIQKLNFDNIPVFIIFLYYITSWKLVHYVALGSKASIISYTFEVRAI